MFRFSAADLAASDIVEGGAGGDELLLTSAGTVRAKGVAGVETYVLPNGAGNVLSLANANFAGVTGCTITVTGGNGADTLGEAGGSALDKAVLKGGVGADTLVAGRNAALTGGRGKDVFVLTVPGSRSAPVSVTIADFAHGTDKLAFSETGFGLGSSPDAATLFAANKNQQPGPALCLRHDAWRPILRRPRQRRRQHAPRNRHPDQPPDPRRRRHRLCRVSRRFACSYRVDASLGPAE